MFLFLYLVESVTELTDSLAVCCREHHTRCVYTPTQGHKKVKRLDLTSFSCPLTPLFLLSSLPCCLPMWLSRAVLCVFWHILSFQLPLIWTLAHLWAPEDHHLPSLSSLPGLPSCLPFWAEQQHSQLNRLHKTECMSSCRQRPQSIMSDYKSWSEPFDAPYLNLETPFQPI